MNKRFMFAEVKTVEGKDPNGEFEAILSAPTLDRDGEVVAAGAFEPLPESIPVHAFHDFHDPIGRGAPFYEGDVLKLRGRFASTPRAQEIRTLVAEGVIGSMSVGFMTPAREDRDGVPHVTKAEILEGSFVSIPSNREAAVLVAKEMEHRAANGLPAKGLADLREALNLITQALTQLAAPEPESAAEERSPNTDPEGKAAADEAAADSPADVDVVLALAAAAQARAVLLV